MIPAVYFSGFALTQTLPPSQRHYFGVFLALKHGIRYNEGEVKTKELFMEHIIQILAGELGQPENYVNNVVTLLDEGNTCLLYTSPSPRDR